MVEEWCRQLHKRPEGCMIGIVPRLMTSRWKKQWKKAADLVLELSIGSTAWVSNQHEPLLLFISLPLRRKEPWFWRGDQSLDKAGKQVQRLWKTDIGSGGLVLRKLLLCAFAEQKVFQ